MTWWIVEGPLMNLMFFFPTTSSRSRHASHAADIVISVDIYQPAGVGKWYIELDMCKSTLLVASSKAAVRRAIIIANYRPLAGR